MQTHGGVLQGRWTGQVTGTNSGDITLVFIKKGLLYVGAFEFRDVQVGLTNGELTGVLKDNVFTGSIFNIHGPALPNVVYPPMGVLHGVMEGDRCEAFWNTTIGTYGLLVLRKLVG